MKRLLATSAFLLLVLLSTARVRAQDSFEPQFIPEEAVSHEVPSLSDPLEEMETGLLLAGALLPLAVAWASIMGRKFPMARRFAVAGIVVAGIQAVYGLSQVLFPETFEFLAWNPDLDLLAWQFRNADDGPVFLGAGIVCGLAAWGTLRSVVSREAMRVPLTAGTRIRVPNAAGPGPAA